MDGPLPENGEQDASHVVRKAKNSGGQLEGIKENEDEEGFN